MATTATDRLNGINEGVAFKAPVRVATTANITLSGAQTIDGVAVVADDRVLVKNQTDTTENGIYIASSSTWSRSPDFDGSRDIVQGTIVYAISGSVGGNTFYQVTTSSPAIGSALAFTSVNTVLSGVSAYMETVLDDTTAPAARTTLGAAASGANTDITSVYLNNTGLKIKDTNASHGLSIVPGSNITADRTLNLATGDADRTITLAGDVSLGGSLTTTASVSIDGNAVQADLEAASSTTKFVTPASIKYGIGVAKAAGTVTYSAGTPSLSGSFGVTSITDTATGTVTVNLSVTMSGTYQVIATPLAVAVGGVHAESHGASSFVIKIYTESGGSFPLADINFAFVVFGDLA